MNYVAHIPVVVVGFPSLFWPQISSEFGVEGIFSFRLFIMDWAVKILPKCWILGRPSCNMQLNCVWGLTEAPPFRSCQKALSGGDNGASGGSVAWSASCLATGSFLRRMASAVLAVIPRARAQCRTLFFFEHSSYP